jgi:hypothetical protein
MSTTRRRGTDRNQVRRTRRGMSRDCRRSPPPLLASAVQLAREVLFELVQSCAVDPSNEGDGFLFRHARGLKLA